MPVLRRCWGNEPTSRIYQYAPWSKASSEVGSSLPFRRADHEAIEVVGHLDLTGQPRIRPHVEAEIQHVLFHRRGRAGLLAPGFVNIDMASRTGARAAALGLDARNGVANRA